MQPTPSAAPDRLVPRPAAEADAAELRREILARLDGRPGFAVIGGLDGDAGPERELAFAKACSWFGELLPQDAHGTLVRHVRDRGTRIGEGRSRYADSREGGSLHTDGAEAPPPVPDYFALLCVRAAAEGGALQLVHVDHVVEALEERPDALEVLRRPFHFDRRGDERPGEPPTTAKPILFEEDGVACATYLRQYVEAGHARPDVPDLTPLQVAALDALDEVLASPSLVTEQTMQPGQLAIINNRRLFHGRTAFIDHPEPERARLLYRAWLRRRTTDAR
jgi:alpha-ketoglutarate-dependent taurine dioxygenase